MTEPPLICIGNQTAFSAASLREPFDYAAANGFDAFEFFPDKKPDGAGWDESDLDDAARADIRQTAVSLGMRLSVHARGSANPLPSEAWPGFLKDIGLAKDLGAVLLNIHLCPEEGMDAYLKSVEPLVRFLSQTDLLLSIENTPLTPPEAFNELFARLQAHTALPTDHVGMCLDIGHANLCTATLHDYLGFIDRLDSGVPIIHMHVHENWGDADTHLPLFTGPAGRDPAAVRGLIDRLKQRNYSGSIILEQWPQPPTLLDQARHGLNELLAETHSNDRIVHEKGPEL